MNTVHGKHQSAGSAQPQYNPDRVTVLNMRFCPFAQRTLLVLIKKNIPFDNININLKYKPEWFLASNPLGKVPTLILPNKEVLYESLITCDYLDEAYAPEKSLRPLDPMKWAKDRMVLTHFDKFLSAYYSFYRLPSSEFTSEHLTNFYDTLDVIENELRNRKSDYFSGDQIGMLDYMMWPWFERCPALAELFPRIVWPNERFSTLQTWISRMEKDDVISSYAVSPKLHAEFLRGLSKKNPNYELLAESITKED